MKLSPNMHNNMDTTMLTVLTLFFYVLFVITFQSVAAIMTILAAASTLVWNTYKIITDRNDRRKSKHNQNGHTKKPELEIKETTKTIPNE